MRTVVLSDVHPGNNAGYDIFAGHDALPALLRTCTQGPTRVIFNGDTVDFLMNEDPLELDVQCAVTQARAIASAPETAEVFRGMGEVLAAGGELIFRFGNHDIELALLEVQDVLRGALAQPPEVARRLRFLAGNQEVIVVFKASDFIPS